MEKNYTKNGPVQSAFEEGIIREINYGQAILLAFFFQCYVVGYKEFKDSLDEILLDDNDTSSQVENNAK